jgi:chromosome segregation ATPase
MPATSAKQTDVDFERSASAEQTFWRLQREYDAALLHQPSGATHVALRRLRRIRDQAELSFSEGASEPGEAGDVDFAAEADDTEKACEKLRAKIAALATSSDRDKSADVRAEAKQLTARADSLRTKLKALEAEAEKAADAVAKAEAAARDVAERGRALKAEIAEEIAAVEAKLVRDVAAH